MVRESNASDALADILSTIGTDHSLMDRIKITDADPVLPSKFLIGNAGAGVIGATGLAASELWRLRRGRTQDVSVDVCAAAIGMRAVSYFRKDDGSSRDRRTPFGGFYKGNDGRWILLHCNFPHHAAGVLKVLEYAGEKTVVAKAISTWNIPELETACSEAGQLWR